MPLSINNPLLALTAGDLMAEAPVLLAEWMPLREAARLLLRHHISGAPVMDGGGVCVGVLTTTDFMRFTASLVEGSRPDSPVLPITCSFQARRRRPDGTEVTICALPPGVCSLQVKPSGPEDQGPVLCNQPHCVLVDWQIVDVERLPTDEVRRFMNPNPVTARRETPISVLARRMIDAHLHRIIVVDEDEKPIGVVSSSDLLEALAYAEKSEAETPGEHREEA
jgi:CBS domain-containing protein